MWKVVATNYIFMVEIKYLNVIEQIAELKKGLPCCFYQCHKSYLINFDYVRQIEKNKVILKSNEIIPISRTNYSSTRSSYFDYLRNVL
jgi:DNA-binding LytR/AlgR family response regulator